MIKPLLSICIPTRNRQAYCFSAVSEILRNQGRDYEVVVFDTSDDEALKQKFNQLNDDRLKYHRGSAKSSSSQNMSDSIEASSGNYVCMIGDDDIVLPSIFDLVRYMEENKIPVGAGNSIPEYIWPDENNPRQMQLKIVRPRWKKNITLHDLKNRVSSLFRSGVVGYQEYRLPRVYHGVVRRDIINKIYREGTYFYGLSPDIYSSVALGLIVDSNLIWNKPISIGGVCPSSTTSAAQQGNHSGLLQDAPHLRFRTDYIWEPDVPPIYSVATIWAESALKALRFHEHSDSKIKFGRTNHLCDLLSSDPNIRKQVKVLTGVIESMPSAFNVSMWALRRFAIRATRKILFKHSENYEGVKNISVAREIIQNDFNRNTTIQ